MSSLCKDCSHLWIAGRSSELGTGFQSCPLCSSVRVITHNEVSKLNIAHIDCDSFYASVEKCENPSLHGKPVIVGGGRRGVVAACCYVARISGVRSAMPMFEALRRCPEAVVISPNMKKYSLIGRRVRLLMESITPLVEPISIDEAFLDLTGTEAVHGGTPAQTLVKLINRIEAEEGITASVGLSYNKFLSKVASDLNKPRGFSIIGLSEAKLFLQNKPVTIIWGVGKSLRKKLQSDGVETIDDLRKYEAKDLILRYGAIGKRLSEFAIGNDKRSVLPHLRAKSVSAETTFLVDTGNKDELKRWLWFLSEKISKRLKAKNLICSCINLKLKKSNFRSLSRSKQMLAPTQMAEEIYRNASYLLTKQLEGHTFRLIGLNVTKLQRVNENTSLGTLDVDQDKLMRIEKVIDKVRGRFGDSAIAKGRGFKTD